MSKGCDEHGKILMVFLNRKCCFGKVSNISRGNWPCIDNFDNCRFPKLESGDLILACKSIIDKGIPSSTTVNEGISLDANM